VTALPDPARRVPPVPLLVAFSVLGPVTIHMVLPALPFLQHEFGTDYATVQLLISAFVLAFGGGQVLVGPLADLYGRRLVLCGGMALFTLASVLCALAPNVQALIALRALQGLAACTGTVLSRAIIREYWELPTSTRILGYLAMGISIGPIIAPTAGGLLFQAAGWRMPFWTLAVLGLANTALALALVPRQKGSGGGDGLRRLAQDIRRLLRERSFLAAWLTVSFNAGCVFTFIANASLISNMVLDLSPTAFGAWFGLGAVGYISGNFVAGRISRLGETSVLAIGAILVAVAALAMAAVLGLGLFRPLPIFGLFSFIMAASGLVMPNAFAASMAAVPAAAGSASGFVGFAQYVVGAVFAALASYLVESHHAPVFLGAVMVTSALCGLAVALWMLRHAARRA